VRKNFLSRGPGAAAGSLGGAYTAVAEDLTAIYYNPAGLAFQGGGFYAEHMPVHAGGRFNFLGLNYPARFGSLGFGVIQFAVDDIDKRQAIGDPPITIQASQTAWFLPYSHYWKSLSYGFSIKKIDNDLDNQSDSGLGMDVGGLYSRKLNDRFLFINPGFQLGLVVKNILEPEEDFSREATLGLALKGNLMGKYSKRRNLIIYDQLQISIDATQNPDDHLQFSFGAEYGIKNLIQLRAGFSHDFSIGMGYGSNQTLIQVGYALLVNEVAPQHRFSFSYRFKNPKSKPSLSPKLRKFRVIKKDAHRLQDRFIEEGRGYLKKRQYDKALVPFEKAWVLDPQNPDIRTYLERAKEGFRLKEFRKQKKKALKVLENNQYRGAVENVMEATKFVQNSREARDFILQVRGRLYKLGEEPTQYFERLRKREMELIHEAFYRKILNEDIKGARILLDRANLINPQSPLTRKLAQDLSTSQIKSFDQYMDEANLAMAREDYQTCYVFFDRAREIFPNNRDLKNDFGGFVAAYREKMNFKHYDELYHEQLYKLAALHYVSDEIKEAKAQLKDLLNRNAIHPTGHFLRKHFWSKNIIEEEWY